jgi:hypothetical protein
MPLVIGRSALFFGRRVLSEEARNWLNLRLKHEYFPTFEDWRRESGGSVEAYADAWVKQLEHHPSIIRATSYGEVAGLQGAIQNAINRSNKMGIIIGVSNLYRFENKLISVVQIETRATVEFRNCIVRNLSIVVPHGLATIRLSGSWVGEMNLPSGSVGFLEVVGGGIDHIRCPLPYDKSPFVDSVIIRGTWLSRSADNAQAYRNLKHHLNTMHNYEAASIFHSAEMRTIYAEQTSLEKIINLFYRLASNYGASSGRPLLWFLIFSAFDFALFWYVDGATLVPDVTTDVGWRESLTGNNALRSCLLVLTQIFNPLNVFGFKGFVTAKTVGLAIANVLLGFFATLSLALCLLALRRRFRWSGE